MSKIVGIDLGTTNSLVATVDAGIPFVIADADGQRLTPSVVHFPSDGTEPVVGRTANRVRVIKPAETVYSVKRFMGRRGAEIAREEMLVTYPVKGEGNGPVTIDIRGRAYTPEEISAEILKKLNRDAETSLGEPITRAVITVPAYFNDAQRNATKKAGELAGFTVERIVNEPTAAALAYGLDKLKEQSKIAVYDLGGGTFDLSILELNNGVFQVLATHGDTRLGGDDLDKRVVDFLLEKIVAARAPVKVGQASRLTNHGQTSSAKETEGGTTDERNAFPLPFGRGEGQGEGANENTPPGSTFPLTPALSPSAGERENRTTSTEFCSPSRRFLSNARTDALAGQAGRLPYVDELAALSRIREAAEQAKIKLSTEVEVEITLPFLTPDFSFSCRLTRAELEDLTRDLIARTRPHCLRALADAKLEAKDLEQVILVGGQTRMPLVRQFVAQLFGCAEFEEVRGGIRLGTDYHRPEGPQLNTSQNPDEAVALGAAIQAEILAGGFKNVLLLDVTPLSLGIETFGGLMNVIIPRNSTIPVKAGEAFTTAVDFQRSMLIQVLQGERERAKDNWSLGRFTIDFEPAPKGVPRVGVQFEIDANGILHVLARDINTGRQQIVEMKSAVDVDDAAVQQMVEESVEHAFEDLRARQWIEAKLRAQETVEATRKSLAEYASEIAPDYNKQIEAALEAVETVLANENLEAKTGDSQKLKAANTALDEVTKLFAAFVMDKVVEAMLEKKGFGRSTQTPN